MANDLERLLQIKRATISANPTHRNPAWLNTHNDLVFALGLIDKLMGVNVMDIQDWEREACVYGGNQGGEYLESIKVFDLAKLTHSQWETFCEVVCMNYHAKRMELQPSPF